MKRFCTLLLSALPLTALWLGCADTHSSNPVPVDPTTLPPPAQGEGFQLKVDSFDVPAGTEEQDCYFFKVGDLATAAGLPAGQPVNLHRVQTVQKEGSHHMNIFRVRTIVNLDPTKGTVRGTNGAGECFKSPNWADWPLIANSQHANIDELKTEPNQQSAAALLDHLTWWARALESARTAGK